MANEIDNIKHLLSSINSNEAKIRCEYILLLNSQIANNSKSLKLISKLKQRGLYTAAALIMEKITFNYLNDLHSDISEKATDSPQPNIGNLNLSEKLQKLRQLSEKTLNSYLKIYMHEKAAHFMLGLAEANFENSQKIKAKASFLENKSSSEKTKYAHASAKKLKNQSKQLFSLYSKLLKASFFFWQQAAIHYKKGERPGLAAKVRSRYHVIFIQDIKDNKSPIKAFKKALRLKWFSTAAMIGKEIQNQRVHKKCALLVEKHQKKNMQIGEKLDFSAKVKLNTVNKLKKDLEFIKKRLQRNRTMLVNLFSHPIPTLNFFLTQKKLTKAASLSRKELLLAREAFVEANCYGKVTELDNKILPLEKRFSEFLEESAKQRINGDITILNKLLMDLPQLLDELLQNGYINLHKVLKTEQKYLNKIVEFNKKADRLEMQADESNDHNIKIKFMTKAMYTYEKAALFKQAMEVARKTEKRNLETVYRKINSFQL